MLAVMWDNRNSRSLLVGVPNGTATLEDSLLVSYKTKHALTIRASNHSPCYLPKGAENSCLCKNVQVNVYSHFILNRQNLDATKMSFSG